MVCPNGLVCPDELTPAGPRTVGNCCWRIAGTSQKGLRLAFPGRMSPVLQTGRLWSSGMGTRIGPSSAGATPETAPGFATGVLRHRCSGIAPRGNHSPSSEKSTAEARNFPRRSPSCVRRHCLVGFVSRLCPDWVRSLTTSSKTAAGFPNWSLRCSGTCS